MMPRRRQFHSRLPTLLLAAATLAACAAPPPRAAPGKLLGYGTPGVESHLQPGQGDNLQALLARCQGVAEPVGVAPGRQTLEAACDQLHRTMHNQPGNSAGP